MYRHGELGATNLYLSRCSRKENLLSDGKNRIVLSLEPATLRPLIFGKLDVLRPEAREQRRLQQFERHDGHGGEESIGQNNFFANIGGAF